MTLLELERIKARELRKLHAHNRYLRRHGRVVPKWTTVSLIPLFVESFVPFTVGPTYYG